MYIICFSFHSVCFFYLSPFGFLNLSSSVGQQSYKGLSLPRVSSFALQLKKETKSLDKVQILYKVFTGNIAVLYSEFATWKCGQECHTSSCLKNSFFSR